MKISLLTALLAFILLASISHCTTKYPNGLWPLQIFGKFSSAPNQKILAYYDFNRDRNVDLLTESFTEIQSQIMKEGSMLKQKSITQSTLTVYLWNTDKQIFQAVLKKDFTPVLVDTVIVTDFDQNGKVDLVLTTSDINKKIIIMYYELTCLKKQCSFSAKQSAMQTVTYSDNFPTVAQIMGRNQLISSTNGSLKTTYYDQVTKMMKIAEFAQNLEGNITGMCTNFDSFFYLDYNGDCIQDIVISCISPVRQLQFFIGKISGKFQFQSAHAPFEGQNELQMLNVNIRDINFDGLPDLVILGYSNMSLKHFLQIHYNIGVKSTVENCIIKDSAMKFPYNFIMAPDELLTKIQKIQRIAVNFAQNNSNNKFVLRFGDINNDGFTDLIIDGQNQVLLLNNELCDDSCLLQQYNTKFIKQWSILKIRNFKKATIQLSGVDNINKRLCSLSFFDFYQDGRLDLLGNQCMTNTSLSSPVGRVVPILNSLKLDAFFMKILILNNLNNDKIQQKLIDQRINSNGGHIDMYVTSLSGQRVPTSGDQMANPGFSLQLPYIHIGLGRTNNYAQQLVASINRKGGQQIKVWTPIVPNSQLLIVPGPSQKWVLSTFISPTAVMGVVFWFVVLILIVMGLYIAHLNKKQKQQDKENEQSFYAILR